MVGAANGVKTLAGQVKSKIMTITLSAVYIIIASLSILGGAIGLWVKMQTQVTKIKSRVYYLETNDNELKTMLSDITAKLQHIELLLASNQIKRK